MDSPGFGSGGVGAGFAHVGGGENPWKSRSSPFLWIFGEEFWFTSRLQGTAGLGLGEGEENWDEALGTNPRIPAAPRLMLVPFPAFPRNGWVVPCSFF